MWCVVAERRGDRDGLEDSGAIWQAVALGGSGWTRGAALLASTRAGRPALRRLPEVPVRRAFVISLLLQASQYRAMGLGAGEELESASAIAL